MKVFPLETPAFRAIHVIPYDQGGQQLLVFQDPLGLIEEPVVMPPDFLLVTLLQMANGQNDVAHIARVVRAKTDMIVTSDKVLHYVQYLDKAGLMLSEHYLELVKDKEETYRQQDYREALMFQSDDKLAVIKALKDEFKRHLNLPNSPSSNVSVNGELKGVLCPHIDYIRGGAAYAWAYRAIQQNTKARRFIILGTLHTPSFEPYIITDKPFKTVLGSADIDHELVREIEEKYSGNLRSQEYLHTAETTIELQVTYLQQILGDEKFTIVPILVGNFDQYLDNKEDPYPDCSNDIKNMISVLENIMASQDDVVLIGGVDFAHCGQEFGDEYLVDEQVEKEIAEQDQIMMERIIEIDPDGFFDHFRPDLNERKVCSVAAIYTVLSALEDNHTARKLTYDQSNNDTKTCMVTFGSFAFSKNTTVSSEE